MTSIFKKRSLNRTEPNRTEPNRTEPNRTEPNRNHLIDALKGICIVFILITHFSFSNEERLKLLFPFWIDMAVPIFMLISGYVYSFSYEKNKISQIGDAYLIKNTASKMIRYTVPFVITFLIEVVALLIHGNVKPSLDGFFSIGISFLCGGVGPGSYYYPAMMQFIFVLPIIFFIIKKYKFRGVVLCGFINALYELLQCAYGMNEDCYRLLMFRYILLIAIGCYIATCDYALNIKALFISCILGMGFIVAYSYLGYEPKIIIYWTRTSFIACLYIIPIAMIVIRKLGNIRFAPLEVLGKASYNIFLVQMVWYAFVSGRLANYISNRLLQLAINLVICLGLGVLFYYIEMPVTKWINKKVYILINKNDVNTRMKTNQ